MITSTVYSRDLGNKEMMMELMMNLLDDMFKQEILQYLAVHDIVKLDSACMNHKYRPQLLDKINGVILQGDKSKSIKASLFKWLGIRRIYLINMKIVASEFYSTASNLENNYVDQFKYTQHVVMRGAIKDDMAIFILSHSPCLLSVDISKLYHDSSSPKVTDHTLQSIAEHCTGRLQSLTLKRCREITDAGLITISEHYPNLKSLTVDYCYQITDVSIISISVHCTALKSLHLSCYHITDASIISISQNCTGLRKLNIARTAITDASLKAIAKNCTGLQYLDTDGCEKLSSDKLRRSFKSVSELRPILWLLTCIYQAILFTEYNTL